MQTERRTPKTIEWMSIIPSKILIIIGTVRYTRFVMANIYTDYPKEAPCWLHRLPRVQV